MVTYDDLAYLESEIDEIREEVQGLRKRQRLPQPNRKPAMKLHKRTVLSELIKQTPSEINEAACKEFEKTKATWPAVTPISESNLASPLENKEKSLTIQDDNSKNLNHAQWTKVIYLQPADLIAMADEARIRTSEDRKVNTNLGSGTTSSSVRFKVLGSV